MLGKMGQLGFSLPPHLHVSILALVRIVTLNSSLLSVLENVIASETKAPAPGIFFPILAVGAALNLLALNVCYCLGEMRESHTCPGTPPIGTGTILVPLLHGQELATARSATLWPVLGEGF